MQGRERGRKRKRLEAGNGGKEGAIYYVVNSENTQRKSKSHIWIYYIYIWNMIDVSE